MSVSNLFAKTLTFTEEKYSGSITFNDNVQLGDAIFVRLNIKFLKTQKKKNLKETQAVLKLFSNDRQIECSRFFSCFPQGTCITADNVDSVLADTKGETAFTLFGAMVDAGQNPSRRLENSLSILQKIRLSKDVPEEKLEKAISDAGYKVVK